MANNLIPQFPQDGGFEDEWPKGDIAPCRDDGEVKTCDEDNKEAACHCPIRDCMVDWHNRIIFPAVDFLGRRGRDARRPPPQ